MTYQHLTLKSPSSVRLLLLHPAQDVLATLSGSLVEFDIRKKPHPCYEALSYAWGPSTTAHMITIGSSYLPITASCEAALRSLRQSFKDRMLWVDAICIDQTEDAVEERNGQVAMMGDIYEAATDVLVWLGEGGARIHALFLHLSRLYTLRDESWETSRSTLCNKFVHECEAKWKTTDAIAIEDIVEELLCRPWFERMWTLQELLLSSHATLVCGNETVSWDAFHCGFQLIDAAFAPASRGMRNLVNCIYAYSYFRSNPMDELDNISESSESSESTDDASQTRNLSTMMYHARIRQAGDPKDKVFALYGLSQKIGKPMPEPDYTLSTAAIYARATAAIIQYDNSLWPLDNVWTEQRRPDLPSWVADWNCDQRFHDDIFSELGGLPPDPADLQILVPSRGPVYAKISADYQELTVRGREIGVVDKIIDDSGRAWTQRYVEEAKRKRESVEYESARRKHGAEQIKFLRRLYTEMDNGSLACFRLLQAFAEKQSEVAMRLGCRDLRSVLLQSVSPDVYSFLVTCAMNRLVQSRDEKQKHPMILSLMESDVDVALDIMLSRDIDCEELAEHSPSQDPDLASLFAILPSASGFYHLVRGVSYNNSVFTTTTGLLGYAHGTLRSGDLVFQLDGCQTPSVLYPWRNQYKLRSPAVIGTYDEFLGNMEDIEYKEIVLV